MASPSLQQRFKEETLCWAEAWEKGASLTVFLAMPNLACRRCRRFLLPFQPSCLGLWTVPLPYFVYQGGFSTARSIYQLPTSLLRKNGKNIKCYMSVCLRVPLRASSSPHTSRSSAAQELDRQTPTHRYAHSAVALYLLQPCKSWIDTHANTSLALYIIGLSKLFFGPSQGVRHWGARMRHKGAWASRPFKD